MGRKKGNKYAAKQTVAPERVAELRQALVDGTLESATDAEVDTLVAALEEEGRAELLVALRDVAAGKPQRKAVNQALYRLEQRGDDVPDWRDLPEGIDLSPTADAIADLPVLMNEPYSNGARLFLLPHQSGRLLLLLQARFEHPGGLQVLSSAEVGRASYRSFIKRMIQSSMVEGSPAAVRADDRLRQRKLWEIGRLVHEGKTGGEVDHQLVAELRFPDDPPPHPALDLPLDDVEPLDRDGLANAVRMAGPFIGDSLWSDIESGLAEAETSPLILSETTEAGRVADVHERAVDGYLADRDIPMLAEVFLDAALFHGLSGNLREARTLRDVVAGVPEDRLGDAIRRFMLRWVAALFTPPAPADEQPDSGGLVVP